MRKEKASPAIIIYGRSAARDPGAEAQQVADLEALAKSLKGEVMATFTDWGVSGMTMDRAGLQALLEYIEHNAVDCLLIRDLARLSRDHTDVEDTVSRITATGVEIMTTEWLFSQELAGYWQDLRKCTAACAHRRYRRVKPW